MNYSQTLTVLKQQRSILDQTIATLERLTVVGMGAALEPKVERRGRKGMNPHEREMVSIRMKNYWAERRGGQTNHAHS
jgi:hypothetical protein